jgi:transcriptional regulator with XRE-family HTH domain
MDMRILLAIRERGMRQRDLARIIGISESNISRVVNGIYNPDAVLQSQIAKALKCKPEKLFDATNNQRDRRIASAEKG